LLAAQRRVGGLAEGQLVLLTDLPA
jgi:hypothetical protein